MNQTVEKVLPIPIKDINLVLVDFVVTSNVLTMSRILKNQSFKEQRVTRRMWVKSLLKFLRKISRRYTEIRLSQKDDLHKQKQAWFQRSDRVLDLRWLTWWWLKKWSLQSQRPLSFLGKVSRRCPSKMQPQTQKAKVHSSYIPKSGQLLLTTVQQKSR